MSQPHLRVTGHILEYQMVSVSREHFPLSNSNPESFLLIKFLHNSQNVLHLWLVTSVVGPPTILLLCFAATTHIFRPSGRWDCAGCFEMFPKKRKKIKFARLPLFIVGARIKRAFYYGFSKKKLFNLFGSPFKSPFYSRTDRLLLEWV